MAGLLPCPVDENFCDIAENHIRKPLLVINPRENRFEFKSLGVLWIAKLDLDHSLINARRVAHRILVFQLVLPAAARVKQVSKRSMIVLAENFTESESNILEAFLKIVGEDGVAFGHRSRRQTSEGGLKFF